MKQSKVAFIGSVQTVVPFMALGIDVFPVDSEPEAPEVFGKLVRSRKYAIIFITENLEPVLSEQIDKIAYEALPSVILLPQISGSLEMGLSFVRETMKKAAGRDIAE
ncbi:V-type ATP synthase subunit F [bacterium]|nr:V-type ATP synthase subunit F [bacterium]